VNEPNDVTLSRLEDQLAWYDRKGGSHKRWYLLLRITVIVAAAAVPLFSLLDLRFITSGLGALIVIVEGIQQLNGFHENWLRYRATAENLKHEKYLYAAAAGPYRAADDPKRLLAERVEELVSTEHSRWASDMNRGQDSRASAPGASRAS
jgi:hypothetical protein